MKRLLLALAVTSLFSCSSKDDATTPVAQRPSGWHVARKFIRDPDGRAVILRGVNVGRKTAPYFDFHTPEDFKRIAQTYGMNALRFLIFWTAIEPKKGEYDRAYLDGLVQRMQWAKDAGLLVVVDAHQDLYGEPFGGDGAPRWTCAEENYAKFVPRTPWFFGYDDPYLRACVDGFWNSTSLQDSLAGAISEVAKVLKDNPAVIGFEPMNEPQWGNTPVSAFEETKLQPFYERVVPKVRAVAPQWLAFLEPGANRNLGIPTRLVPMPFDNVVYAPHSYDGSAEAGGGFDPKGHDQLAANVAALRNDADELKAALWVGEYGGNASNPGIGSYMDAEYVGAGSVGAGQMLWIDGKGGGYTTLDEGGNEKKELLDAVVRPYPMRVAGDPVSWTHDQTTGVFTFVYRPDRTLTAPTEISLPARAYPSKPTVDCGGCTFDLVGNRLTITRPAAGDQVTVTVKR